MTGAETAHAGGVDDGDAISKQVVRDRYVDTFDGFSIARVTCLRDPLAEPFHIGQLDDDGLPDAPPDLDPAFLAVADQSQGGRCQIVIDRADVLAEQGVHERTLALLESPTTQMMVVGRVSRATAIRRRLLRSSRPSVAAMSAVRSTPSAIGR